MFKPYLYGISAIFAMSFSLSAFATPFNFQGTGGDLNTNTLTVNGVTAEGFYYDGSSWSVADLYQRNTTNDTGIGVCSPGETACQGGTGNAGGGDVNELSNQLVYEVIRLDKGSYATWEELWVSSLDSSEVGTLYWGNSSDINTLLGGSMFSYDTSNFSGVNGDILSLQAAFDANFDATARYVLFTPGSSGISTGTDNDYLVWKGAVVPAPAVLGLLCIGLVGVGAATNRRNKKY